MNGDLYYYCRQIWANHYLNKSLISYLNELGSTARDRTYQSHKTALFAYLSWYHSSGYCPSSVNEKSIAQFARDTFPDYSITTLQGYLSTLANFLAYLYQDDPELVKIRTLAALSKIQPSLFNKISSPTSTVFELQNTNSRLDAVEIVIQYLRQCRHGSRLHVFTEMVVDTRNRFKQIRDIDCEDIDRENGTVIVDIPDMYLVSSTGIVSERLAVLSENTLDSIEMYLEHERETHPDSQSPLFTSSHGRVTDSTIRRSLSRASESAESFYRQTIDSEADSSEELPSTEAFQDITPRDIRRYSLSQIVSYL